MSYLSRIAQRFSHSTEGVRRRTDARISAFTADWQRRQRQAGFPFLVFRYDEYPLPHATQTLISMISPLNAVQPPEFRFVRRLIQLDCAPQRSGTSPKSTGCLTRELSDSPSIKACSGPVRSDEDFPRIEFRLTPSRSPFVRGRSFPLLTKEGLGEVISLQFEKPTIARSLWWVSRGNLRLRNGERVSFSQFWICLEINRE
jgi:hypothetical protein